MLLERDFFRVLDRNDDSVDARRDHFAVFKLVLARDLRLRVGAQPLAGRIRLSQLRHFAVEIVRQRDRQRHAFFRLVCRVTEHQSLITSADVVVVSEKFIEIKEESLL